MGTLRSISPIRIRNTTRRVKEEQQMIMSLLKTDTLPFDPPMAMCHMDTAHIQVKLDMDTTTIIIWLMTEDIQHPEMPTYKRVLKRREIETTNPLEISIQIVSDRRRNVAKIVKEKEVIMSGMNLIKKVGLVA